MMASSLVAIALLAVSAPPGVASAIWLSFQNDSSIAVVVQTASIQSGHIRNDQPLVLRVGQLGRLPFRSDKLLTIYEGKSNRILYQTVVPYRGKSASYLIQPDPLKPGTLRLEPVRVAGPSGT
ncbi:MAG: hypothetical protein SNJ82_13865 [Gemmataceae bacterium]